jgi:tRNA(fMet)-specific endonuclease VapC
MFLLDTDHISILQRKRSPDFHRLHERMSRHEPSEFWVSIISFHEQLLGWSAYLNQARQSEGAGRAYQMFEQILLDFAVSQVAPFDTASSKVFDQLRQKSVRIATMDLRIAAICLSRKFVLLTRNAVDFRKVPGLVIEDWTT